MASCRRSASRRCTAPPTDTRRARALPRTHRGCGPNRAGPAPTPHRRRIDAASTPHRHRIDAASTPHRHRIDTASTPHRHRIDTASTPHRHRIDTASTPHRHRIDTASTPHRHRRPRGTRVGSRAHAALECEENPRRAPHAESPPSVERRAFLQHDRRRANGAPHPYRARRHANARLVTQIRRRARASSRAAPSRPPRAAPRASRASLPRTRAAPRGCARAASA
ncbi:hypothetical protein Y035_4581 [Burkholderia pseudomallei MSHR465J]|nr:hypothetical protein Y035_4581 [Burkholderia pseudomallei MSHR465J]